MQHHIAEHDGDVYMALLGECVLDESAIIPPRSAALLTFDAGVGIFRNNPRFHTSVSIVKSGIVMGNSNPPMMQITCYEYCASL